MRMIDINSFIRVSKLTSESDELIHLDIIFNTEHPGLWQSFRKKQDLEHYIMNNTETAYEEAILKINETHYILNCEIVEKDGLYIDENKWLKYVGECIVVFMPIIQKFMVDALTDNLYIIEDGKLVKQ